MDKRISKLIIATLCSLILGQTQPSLAQDNPGWNLLNPGYWIDKAREANDKIKDQQLPDGTGSGGYSGGGGGTGGGGRGGVTFDGSRERDQKQKDRDQKTRDENRDVDKALGRDNTGGAVRTDPSTGQKMQCMGKDWQCPWKGMKDGKLYVLMPDGTFRPMQ